MQRAIRSAVSSAESASRWSSSSEKAPPPLRAATSLERIRLSQQPGDMAKRGVAGDPAMAVVDRLEIVEVDREQGRRRAVAGGLAQHPLELAHELARVEQGGERVAAGILLELAEPGAGIGQARRGAAHSRR